ncbi:hypothetical protein EV663_1162 [Rhodovulum bhavnagarense]|uniref:DUF3313 domain-containing protein n=1 Tax=Rhodovulum bhavnagarense TaxID=992286 RepID=A0A4R2RCK8_9RHOB|nr:hypothetical protein [Rhodovulum bhavnagarense]TCP59707.1 hypothetical protein EV663_1162 [Rhodovulum bhavnagarense]
MVNFRSAARITGVMAAVAVLAGCGAGARDLDEAPKPLGDFRLGYAIVVDKNAQMVPPSRKAEVGEWQIALETALRDRFGRYEGEKLYHIALNVDGYALAVPGIPVVLAPKSILVVSANLWDDAAGGKLNQEAEQLAVFEELTGDTVVGSGLTRTREEQMKSLAENMAKRVETWLAKNREDWFAHDPETAIAPPARPSVGADVQTGAAEAGAAPTDA